MRGKTWTAISFKGINKNINTSKIEDLYRFMQMLPVRVVKGWHWLKYSLNCIRNKLCVG